MDRHHYRYDDVNSILQRVLIAQPGGSERVFVYVPPVGGALPYTVDFDDIGDAIEFASRAQAEMSFAGQIVLYTRDREEWWLTNLIPI